MTNKNKIPAYILTIILFIVAVMLYLSAASKGFPDGHLTELDRAERPLFYVSGVLSLLMGLVLLYLARFSKAHHTHKIFNGVIVILLILIISVGGLHWYFISNLDGGFGGWFQNSLLVGRYGARLALIEESN